MKSWIISIFVALFVVIFIIGMGVHYLKQQKYQVISPVLGISNIVLADNVWLPKDTKTSLFKLNRSQILTAEAAYYIEADSGEVLFAKNENLIKPIASLTKIMTVIIAMESANMDSVFKVSKRAAEMEPDKMLLIEGETLTLKELLSGIFLVSANDASEVIAEGTTGRREEFINLMNSKAKQLGLYNTKFINPTGLEERIGDSEDGELIDQHSSAKEVAIMARYAIKNWPQLLEISSQSRVVLPQTKTHQDYDLNNGINLITSYPGVLGFKTGYTPSAGLTLVSVAKKEGKTVIGVLLNSVERRDDAKLLLDYSFERLGIK